MNKEAIIRSGKKVIELEVAAVQNMLGKINGQFADAVETIYNSDGRVVITGVGKSGLIARKIVATLNSTGTPSIYLHPTDALHGDLGMVRQGDTIILISKSGATEELLNVTAMLKRINIPMIGMLGESDSKLGRLCDLVLDIYVAEEACPHDLAPTASTTATLVMGDALAIALLELRDFTPEDFAIFHPAGSLGKRLSLKITEIMYSGEDVPKVYLDTPIKDTIYEITSKRLGTTSVVDSEGILKGIVTDGDLRRLLEKTLDIKELTAKDIMCSTPKTIGQEHLASLALQRMENYNITSLIVIDAEGRPVGILHLHDLVKLGLRRR